VRGYDFWVLRDPRSNEFCVLHTSFPDLPRPAPAMAGLTGPGPAPLATALLHQGSLAAFGCLLRVSSLRCGSRRGS
jgi:hypothetical protein